MAVELKKGVREKKSTLLNFFFLLFLSEAKPSDLVTLGVLLLLIFLLVCGGGFLELTYVQFFIGVFKSCQILYTHLPSIFRGAFKEVRSKS